MAQERDERKVLELRVHGVNNTPPAAMLDLPVDQVEEVLGDDLAGFWRPKLAKGAPGPDTRGHVPHGITREAYSWGGLARRTPGGGVSAGSKLLAGMITTGWTFLLPFGLANVAYWTRSLETSDQKKPSSQSTSAFFVRLFGLCLTAFLIITVCEVSMDLVASQCYRPRALGADSEMVCSRLPGIVAGLAKVGLSVRLVAYSALPVAVLLGLWALSSLSRSRYERAFPSVPTSIPATEHPDRGPKPALSRDDMWRGDVMVRGLAHLHLATGFAVVVVCLALPVIAADDPHCGLATMDARRQCRQQLGKLHDAKPYLWIAFVLAILLLVIVVGTALVRASDGPDLPGEATAPKGVVLGSAVGLLIYVEVAMLYLRPTIDQTKQVAGLSTLPTILLVVMLALAAGAFLLRIRPWLAWLVSDVIAISLCVIALENWHALLVKTLLMVALLALAVRLALLFRSEKRGKEAWAGAGPGIFLGMALLAQGVLSALVVLVAGDWLNGENGAGTLSPREHPAMALKYDACDQLCPGQDPFLTVPTPYLLLGAACVVAVVVLLLAVGVAYLRSGDGLDEPAHLPTDVPKNFWPSIIRARRFARVAHRAEKFVGLLTVVGLLLVLAVAIASAAGLPHWDGKPGAGPPGLQRLLDLSTAAVAALGAAALAALVKGAGSGARRPLGLVWDLVSFLPRASHPFAPPCYAERAVPELTDRVAWWLNQPSRVVGGQRRGGSRVVISAHSLGGVLTVAALMREPLERHEDARSIRLLTYGSQLRAYFGRIFPELLGPEVLGTPPSEAASYWSPDPWDEEADGDGPEWTARDWSVVGRLSRENKSTLWRSLWRPTDYLGFPVKSFQPNDIDTEADEADRSGYLLEVLTHSNYPRTSQYREALRDLAARP